MFPSNCYTNLITTLSNIKSHFKSKIWIITNIERKDIVAFQLDVIHERLWYKNDKCVDDLYSMMPCININFQVESIKNLFGTIYFIFIVKSLTIYWNWTIKFSEWQVITLSDLRIMSTLKKNFLRSIHRFRRINVIISRNIWKRKS